MNSATHLTILFELTDPAKPGIQIITLDYIPHLNELLQDIRLAVEGSQRHQPLDPILDPSNLHSDMSEVYLLEHEYTILGFFLNDPRILVELFSDVTEPAPPPSQQLAPAAYQPPTIKMLPFPSAPTPSAPDPEYDPD